MYSHLNLPKNHYFLTVSSEIDDLLDPLKRHGVAFFTYFRTYPDSSQICISNQAEWVEDYYRLGLYKSSQYQSHPDKYHTRLEVWPTESPLPVFQVAREKLHSDHGITIIKQQENYCEFFFLSSQIGNVQAINFFVNNQDLLERFIMYFTSRAEKLLKKSAQHRIIIPYLDEDKLFSSFTENGIQQTIERLKVKNYRISAGKFKGIKLTARELDCVYALANGSTTAKQVALRLNLSHRTVHSYLNNVKDKLTCYKKTDITKALFQLGLPNIKWFTDEY